MKLGGALGNPANELMVFGPDGLCHSSALHGNTWLRRSGEEPGARWGRSETTFRPMNKASRGRGGWGCPSGVELKLQLQAGFYAMLFAQRQRAISDICGHQRNKCVVACYVFILMRRLFHLLVCSFFLVFLLPWLYSWLSWTSLNIMILNITLVIVTVTFSMTFLTFLFTIIKKSKSIAINPLPQKSQ